MIIIVGDRAIVAVLQGAVNPDEFYVFKPTLNKGLGAKKIKMIYGIGSTKVLTRNLVSLLIKGRNEVNIQENRV